MHRAAIDRLAKLKASEAERAPRVELLEAASPKNEPWRPEYHRDAAIAAAGSLLFGLFAIWFGDFIVGPPPSPAMQMQHSWAPAALGIDAARQSPPLAASAAGRLPAPEPLPRELADAEVTALVAAATADARLATMALLMGLTSEELVALRWDGIDLAAGVIRVPGKSARDIPLVDPLRALVIARRQTISDPAIELLHDAQGGRLMVQEIERLVLNAAYDAGLDRPEEVTPAALRYTYLSYLLRQGIRAADVSSIAGDVPQSELIACMRVNSPRERRPLELIDRVVPALRALADNEIG
jgi:integrase